jgi:hypothetical protein
MDEIISYVAFEGLFLGVFYYVGAMPVWVISLGRYPTRDPRELSRKNRVIYACIGVAFTGACGWLALALSTPGALL